MKIEKINENQIRCTLNKEDLMTRHLRLSELAYGSERAKDLFHDMMEQAATEYGFETEDIPLMIEAVPISTDCLVLLITKVEDPDELDTRFSRFTLDSQEDGDTPSEPSVSSHGADEIINCFAHINQLLSQGETEPGKKKEEFQVSSELSVRMTRIFAFSSLEEVIALAKILGASRYEGSSALYKDEGRMVYFLLLEKSHHTPEEFNKFCNITTEYGRTITGSYATRSYIEEQDTVIVGKNAIHVLANL